MRGIFHLHHTIFDKLKLLPTKGLAILGLDEKAMNSSNSIFLSSRARRNAVRHLEIIINNIKYI